VSLAYAKQNGCGILVAILIAAMQVSGYRGDDITARGLNRWLRLMGDFQLNN
jgi:hypothetical protein